MTEILEFINNCEVKEYLAGFSIDSDREFCIVNDVFEFNIKGFSLIHKSLSITHCDYGLELESEVGTIQIENGETLFVLVTAINLHLEVADRLELKEEYKTITIKN